MKHKHKKTRKQKIIADYRHKEYILENKSSTFSHEALSSYEKNNASESFKKVLDKNTSLDIPTSVISINKNSFSYAYVLNDVLKTGLLTFCIIALQLILLFVLKKHIFSIPNLNY